MENMAESKIVEKSNDAIEQRKQFFINLNAFVIQYNRKFLSDRHITDSSEIPIECHQGWSNFVENIYLAGPVYKFRTTDALAQFIHFIDIHNTDKKTASEARITVRVASGGDPQKDPRDSSSFSFNNGCVGDCVLNCIGPKFNRKIIISPVNTNQISGEKTELDEEENKLFVATIDCSLQLQDIVLELESKGFCICDKNGIPAIISLLPYPTGGGASANAVNGTGGPCFSSLMIEMEMMLTNGKIVTIDENHPDFYYICTHMGLFGILLRLKVYCTQAPDLACTIEVKNVDDHLNNPMAGLPSDAQTRDPKAKNFYFRSVWFIKDEAIIYTWRTVKKDPSKHSYKNYHPLLTKVAQEALIKIDESLDVATILNKNPELIDLFMIAIAKEEAPHGTEIIGPFASYMYQEAYPKGVSDKSYFVTEEGEGFSTYVSVMRVLYDKQKEYEKSYGAPPQNYGFYVRTVVDYNVNALTPAADAKGRIVYSFDLAAIRDIKLKKLDAAKVDVENSKKDENDKESKGEDKIDIDKEFKEWAEKLFLDVYHARCHLGKNQITAEILLKTFGKERVEKFCEVLSNWYKFHEISLEKSMFFNKYYTEIFQEFLQNIAVPLYEQKPTSKPSPSLAHTFSVNNCFRFYKAALEVVENLVEKRLYNTAKQEFSPHH